MHHVREVVKTSSGDGPAAVFDIPTADIDALFAPYVVEEKPASDPQFMKLLKRQLSKSTRVAERGEAAWLDADGRRTTEQVDRKYTSLWSSVSLAEQVSSDKTTWFEWGDRALRARTIARKHLHQLLLVRTLEWLKPTSLLEVGSGSGFNLLLLSMQFPGVELAGIELTEAGVAATRAHAQDPATASLLAPLAIAPIKQPPRLAVDAVRQGTAEALPFAAKSFDTVFTVLALEQMNDVRERVLAELARVARRHVVMIEPFRDFNKTNKIRRRYIDQQNYFNANVKDLRQFGLRPIVATADFPNKTRFYVGLVVASVT